MNQLNVFCEGVKLHGSGVSSRYIKSTALFIMGMIEYQFPDCNIIFSDDSFIQSINLAYRKKNKPTDVISFPADNKSLPGSIKQETAGEIYISIETAGAQAASSAITLKDEITRLLIHGLLHLAGYDHEKSPEEEKIMFSIEESILSAITKTVKSPSKSKV